MKKYKKHKTLFVLYFLIFTLPYWTFSQETKQKRLEIEKIDLEKEIVKINALLFTNVSKKKSLLTQVEDLSLKINVRKKLVLVYNDQVNELSKTIIQNEKKLNDLQNELNILKRDYSKMIIKSYKSKSEQSRLMFLFSSKSFLQAYQRFQYMKQYAKYRKQQSQQIISKTEILKSIKKELLQQKDKKLEIIELNRKIQLNFEYEMEEQKRLLLKLKKEERFFKKQIFSKQKKAEIISQQIQELIKEAIAESNRRSGIKKSTVFNLTPEAKLISENFALNKGKLPWPVIKGVVVQGFGQQPHPIVRTTLIKSNGITLATPNKTIARSIFEGFVMSVLSFKGSNPTVLIQHGNYISSYSNLSEVYVKKGDKVKAKESLGTIFTNPETGRTTLKFSIFEANMPINPKAWIYKL